MIDPKQNATYANNIRTFVNKSDFKQLLKLVSEVRESIEIVHTIEYGPFLEHILPALLYVLSNTQPQTQEDDVQKIRNTIIEVLHRFLINEALRPYANDLMNTCMNIFFEGNEDNAIISMKIMMDLHKYFRKEQQFANIVPKFLDFVCDMYGNFNNVVEETFKVEFSAERPRRSKRFQSPEQSQTSSQQDQKQEKPSTPQKTELIPSKKSFKLLTDVPLLLVLLFQVYPTSVQYLGKLLPRMVQSFAYEVPPPAPNDPKRKHYVDMMTARVKTASFLAYNLRVYPDEIRPYKDKIPGIVTNLLIKCPNEAISSRKELLVIMRHMIDSQNSDLRPHFLGFVEQLLDDNALIGTSRTSFETLRPLAYSTLADLIHHVRSQLTLEQITRTVTFYTRIMYDPSLMLSIQTMSAKLLVHLVESIFKLNDKKEEGRKILVNIMTAFVNKIKSLSIYIERVGKEFVKIKGEKKDEKSPKKEDKEKDSSTRDSGEDVKPPKSEKLEEIEKELKYCRLMLKTLILGLKNVIFVMLSMDQNVTVKTPRTSEELKLFMSLFKHGLDCFPLYSLETNQPQSDDKENLDAFASLFTVLPLQTVQEIFKHQLPYLYEKLLESWNLYFPIPSHFLSHAQVSRVFSDILLSFLIKRMDKMVTTNKESGVLLRLFKAVYGAATLSNHEAVLQPHLTAIVQNCLQHASSNKETINYLLNLRSLFRSFVGKTQGDLLAKDFTGLVPMILEQLTELLKTSFKSPLRDLFVELCLTLPAKLHVLCPYLHLLIRPVLCALQGNSDLVTFGLRNLDMWVDTLRTESLEPILRPVMPELLMALFSHLKPAPYHHGMLAMKILAKLGGLNREQLLKYSKLLDTVNELGETGLSIYLRFLTEAGHSSPFEFPIDNFIILSKKVLYSLSTDPYSRKQAYKFLKHSLISLIRLDTKLEEEFKLPEDIVSKQTHKGSKTSLTIRASYKFFDPYGIEDKPIPTPRKVEAQAEIFKELLESMFFATTVENVQEDAKQFVKGICRHFALLNLGRSKYFPDPLKDLNPDIILDAIVDVLCLDMGDQNYTVGEDAILELMQTFTAFCDLEQVMKLKIWEKFASRLCHSCYQQEWNKNYGGCKGIACLLKILTSTWIRKHEVDFVKALLFVIKNSQPTSFVLEFATNTLFDVITKCHKKEEENGKEQEPKLLHELLLVLVSELSSANEQVRNVIQKLIHLVSELTGQTIKSLLEPFHPSLMKSIKVGRLQQLKIPLQTGFCEAVTFFLSLDPPLLQLTPQIVQIIERAYMIYYARDKEHHLTNEYDRKCHANLRMACMRLLQKALILPELNVTLRTKIIELFFHYLAHQNKEVVEVAKTGLASFISRQKLHKDLLQNSLKPILSNLGNYTKLTLPVLQTLAHLLELCQNYFSVKLGEQLLAHLRVWAQSPNKITHLPPAMKPIVGAHILKLFSLLPEEAKRFLSELVPLTVQLEESWKQFCSEFTSPFREPLTEYLNKYPAEAIEYFFVKTQIMNPADHLYYNLFLSILKSDRSDKIREKLNDSNFILTNVFDAESRAHNYEEKKQLRYKVICITRILAKKDPKFLLNNRPIVDRLIELWKEQINIFNKRDVLTYDYQLFKQSRKLLKSFIVYCKLNEDETDLIFLMLYAFLDKSAMDYSFLVEFFKYEIPEFPLKRKKILLEKFLQSFKSLGLKFEALSYLIMNIIKSTAKKNELSTLMDDATLKLLIDTLFSDDGNYDESIRVELLELATLFVKYIPLQLLAFRKEVLKFALSHIKNDDTTSKQCAYMLCAHFIDAYETPEQIVLHVYVALLKAYKSEARGLVKQALDIFVPALQNRIKPVKNKHPKWVTLTKKMIIEEGHTMPQLIHIWQLFTRHSKLFFPYFDIFVTQIVNSLERIGLHPNHPIENRKLAIELVSLVIEWEASKKEEKLSEDDKKRKLEEGESPSAKRMKTEEGQTPVRSDLKSPIKGEYKSPAKIPELVMNFLIRASSPFRMDTKRATDMALAQEQQLTLTKRCIEVFKKGLEVWPNVTLNPSYLFEIFSLVDAEHLNHELTSTGLKIFKTIFEIDRHPMIIEHLGQFETNFISFLRYPNSKITPSLIEFFQLMITKIPIDQYNSFYSNILNDIKNTLIEATTKPDLNDEAFALTQRLSILKIILENQPQFSSQFSEIIHKVLTILLKKHLHETHERLKQKQQRMKRPTQPHMVTAKPHSQIQMLKDAVMENETCVKSICVAIEILCHPSHETTAFRKNVITTMSNMLDKTNELNININKTVIRQVQKWILTKKENTYQLTNEEKIYFLSKLTNVENNPIAEVKNFYNEVLLSFYEDEGLMNSGTELSNKVKEVFMFGLKSDTLKMRKKFLNVLHAKIGKTIEKRLEYIFDGSNWESIGETFWIRHAVDLILDLIVYEDKISVPETLSKLPNLVDDTFMDIDEKYSIKEEGKKIIQEHAEFLKGIANTTIKDLLLPLREISRESVRVSNDLWITIFPFVINSCNFSDELHKSLISLLGKEYHQKQCIRYPNVIQALLQGIYKCKDKIFIAPEMLKYLCKTFKCWNSALPMLEDLIERNGYTKMEGATHALAELYRLLSEDGMVSGVWRSFDISENTKFVLSLEQLGMWTQMQDALKDLIQGVQKGIISKNIISHSELGLWEEHWIQSSRKLLQWDDLKKYAGKVNSSSLLLECHWQEGDWKAIKEVFMKHPPAENQLLKMYQISEAIIEERRKEALEYLHQATQMALQRWYALPEFTSGAHVNMLNNFQQLLELHDSTRFLASYKSITINELKSFLSTWRYRVPLKWDNLNMWNDILIWRHHFLLNMYKKYGLTNSQPQMAFCLNESIYTLNKYAKISRQHGVTSASLKLLNESKKLLIQIKTETSEYFVRLYEVMCSLNQEYKFKNTIEEYDKDPIIPTKAKIQKIDLLRAKANAHEGLGETEMAFQEYSNSISSAQDPGMSSNAFPSLAKTFLHWGTFMDNLFMASNQKDGQILQQTIASYIQAVRYGSAKGRNYLARVLWLLSFDGEVQNVKPNDIFGVMEKAITDIPLWIWLQYIHNLFALLTRKESQIAKWILAQCAKKYPQALYYYIRSFYFELRDELKNQPEQNLESPRGQRWALIKKNYEELMAQILQTYPRIVKEIESILKDFVVKFKPEPEEELQRELEQLLKKCYKLNINDEEIPNHIIEHINQILSCPFYFPSEGEQQQKNIKTSSYLKEIHQEFRNQMLPYSETNPNGPKNLMGLITNCKYWLRRLQSRVNLLPNILPLENISRYLADYQCMDIEIPGQYNVNREPFEEQHEKILCFLPQVDVIRRNEVSCRRISIRSQSGNIYRFLIQSAPPTQPICYSHSEERTWYLMTQLNRILNLDKSANAHNLVIPVPIMVPILHNVRLVHERSSYCSLEDVYYDFCIDSGKNADYLFIEYWKLYRQMNSKSMVFHEMLKKVPKDILSKFMSSICTSWNEFYEIRKRFTNEYGLLSLITHLLSITDRCLHKILIGKNSGNAFQFDFKPVFRKNGQMFNGESVPFRLTQNLRNFITQFGIEGYLLNSIHVAANAFTEYKDMFINIIRLFVRDELISWHAERANLYSTNFSEDENRLKQTVEMNIQEITNKLQELAPEYTPLNVEEDDVDPLNAKICDLIEIAASNDNLSQMDPTWHPWF